MAKGKQVTQEDLKKFLEKTKNNLHKLGKETKVWLKKGEVELSRISKIGKLELDVVNLKIKREKLLKDIGKRIVDRGLADEINDSAVRELCSKVNVMSKVSNKKKKEISRIGKGFLKIRPTGSKKKR